MFELWHGNKLLRVCWTEYLLLSFDTAKQAVGGEVRLTDINTSMKMLNIVKH